MALYIEDMELPLEGKVTVEIYGSGRVAVLETEEEYEAEEIKIVFCHECRNCTEKCTHDCPSGYGDLYCKARHKFIYDEYGHCEMGERR